MRLGLNREADLKAVEFAGEAPKWEQDWHEVKLFYPGQVSWPLITAASMRGAVAILTDAS